MYQILFNDLPIYDPRDARLAVRDPDCHLAVGEAGELSFIIDPDHPYAQRLTRMNGVLKLLEDGRTIYKGRIRKDPREFDLSRKIESEGLLACLNDSIIPPFDFPADFQEDAAYQMAAESGNVIRFLLEWFLALHNNQTGPDQQIRLGEVTVADPNNYITRSSSDFMTTKDAVQKKLADSLGGHLLVDYSGDAPVLHYYDDLPLTNVQEVEFGENLLDLVDEIDATDTYTAILPLGKDGLTLEELEDKEVSPGIWKEGRIIYSSQAEEDAGGRITRIVKWDDVTLATNLETKALNTLTTTGTKHIRSITVKAADLGGANGIPHFSVGRYVRFRSAPHGFADVYPLMELEPNILDPADTEITMGATIRSASDIAHENKGSLDQIQMDLNKQQGTINRLPQETQQQITQAIQTSQAFILEAMQQYTLTTDFTQLQSTVAAQLQFLAEELSLKFTKSTEYTKEVDGELQKTNEDLSKHFVFGTNGLTIRAGDTEMQLRIDNDLISFYKGVIDEDDLTKNRFGWWDGVDFHTGNIKIDVTKRAQFGDFAYVPRSNGSLSFLKVGG